MSAEYVDPTEDCMGNDYKPYWRKFLTCSDGSVIQGTGDTAEEAESNADRNLNEKENFLRLSSKLKTARLNQPKVSLADAQAQAKRVHTAKDKAGAKSGPFVSRKDFENVLTACVNAEAEVELLKEHLELANVHIADKVDKITQLSDDCNILEQRIVTLHCDLKTCEANKKYACDQVDQRNKFIRESKAKMESLQQDLFEKIESIKVREEVAKVQSEIVTKKSKEADHLARKVVELQAELTRNDYAACPYHKNNYTNLPCGSCTKCKLDAAYGIIDRATANVKHLESIMEALEENVKAKDELLYKQSDKLKSDADALEVAKLEDKVKVKIIEDLKLRISWLNDLVKHQNKCLETISKGAIFTHSKIAKRCIVESEKFLSDHKL